MNLKYILYEYTGAATKRVTMIYVPHRILRYSEFFSLGYSRKSMYILYGLYID